MEDDSAIIDGNVSDSFLVNADGDRWSELSEPVSLWGLSGGADLAGLQVHDDGLCLVCKRRNFKELFFQFVGDTAFHFFTRTLAHVKTCSSSCTFCWLTLVALGLEEDLVVRLEDEETLVRSDYPRNSGTLKDIKSGIHLSFHGQEISPDLHHKGKIYFYLHQGSNTYGIRNPFHRTTHGIQLSLPSKESFAWDSKVHPKLQILGGRLMRDEFDVEMLKTWLSMSDSAVLPRIDSKNSHSQIKATGSAQIRLINVFEGHLITSTTDNWFAALSYVWGGPQQVLLTTETDAELRKPGAITSSHTQLGRTITDALDLCKILGYHYLWIDALCICQDDQEDMIQQIAHMGQIYHSAALTIVQASGDPETSVHTPLKGFLPGSRKIRQEQVIIQNENVLLTCRPPYSIAIQRSKWNTRGWTLQERFLSRRLLYFTDQQIFLTSDEGHIFCEDTVFEHKRNDMLGFSEVFIPTQSFDWDYDPLAKELLPTPAESFLFFVSHYSERVLSNQDDVLAAFSALMNTFVDSLWPADFGIPQIIFDYALCWSPTDVILHSRPKLPTWSWAGWQGSIRFRHDFYPERCRTGAQYAGMIPEPSFAGNTVVDAATDRFKELRDAHGLQVGPHALTQLEVRDYYRNLLGHHRQFSSEIQERFFLHFTTSCQSFLIGAIEQDPPGLVEFKKEAGQGRDEERDAGAFYELNGSESTKLPGQISIVKEWRLRQPEKLTVDFIVVQTIVSWKTKYPPRLNNADTIERIADEAGDRPESDGEVEQQNDAACNEAIEEEDDTRSKTEVNTYLNLIPVTWEYSQACECCDRKHKIARRIGQISVVTVSWDECIEGWISLKPRETLVVFG